MKPQTREAVDQINQGIKIGYNCSDQYLRNNISEDEINETLSELDRKPILYLNTMQGVGADIGKMLRYLEGKEQ